MKIIFSNKFKKEHKKIKDNAKRIKLIKKLQNLTKNPFLGKPLKYKLKNHRSLRISPFRIIYRVEKNKIIINYFEHRKEVYEKFK